MHIQQHKVQCNQLPFLFEEKRFDDIVDENIGGENIQSLAGSIPYPNMEHFFSVFFKIMINETA